MSVTPLLLHVVSITHGVVASLACLALFYGAGLGLIPRRWQDALGRGGQPVVLGAALYLLMCWYGLQFGIRLTPIALAFAALSVMLGAPRGGRAVRALRESRAVRTAATGWLALFAGLYVLAYVFTLPDVTGKHLPIAWTGNIDLLIYLDYTSYLQRLGPALPVELFLATKDYVYFQTPGVFHLLGGFSVFFGADPLRAAMPAQFALTALIGATIAGIARRVFAVSPLAAGVIGAVTVGGPFFRYLAANYFLSTLIALPVLLHFLLTTATSRPREGILDLRLTSLCFGHALVLFFVYPFLFLIALMFQAALIGLAWLAALQDAHDGRPGEGLADAAREAGRRGLALLAAVAGVVALAPGQARWTLRMVRDLSRQGVWGWALDVISPLALLGFPGSARGLAVSSPALRPWAIAGLWLIGVVLAASFFWWFRRRTTPEARVVAGLSALGFLGYAGYFAIVGASYRQWKMASYTVLPLSFVALAGTLRLVGARLEQGLSKHPLAARALATTVPVLVGASFVCGNLLVHAFGDPPLRQFGSETRNVARIAALPAVRDLSLEVPDRATGMLAAYYLPGKRLHLLGPQYYPAVSFDQVSPARPLLVWDYSCDGVGHDDTLTIDGVGCLLFAPPSLLLDSAYPFSHSFLFVGLKGLGAREGWGRWNGGRSVELKLTADPRRVRVDQAAYLNLLLRPSLLPGTERQRLRFSWGAGRRAEGLLAEQRWISLPLKGSDWTGDWLASQTVSLELPDAAAPHWVDGRYLESRPLAVGFLELSLTTSPRGQVLTLLQ